MPGLVTLNVFVKDPSGAPVAGARVTILTRNQIIDPPVRYTQGDGGCNLYFQGPPFAPPVDVSILVDAAGFAPWTTGPTPVHLGSTSLDFPVQLTPSFSPPLPAPARWRGAFVIPGCFPENPPQYGTDGRDPHRIWTPAFLAYPEALQRRQLELYVARYPGGYFVINSAALRTYHDYYPPIPDDPQVLARGLQLITRYGLVPHVCATDDQIGPAVTQAFRACGAQIRSAFPMWEMNGPLPMPAYDAATDTFSGPMVDCIRATIAAAPKAQVLIHFTAGHGAIGLPEDRARAFCARIGVKGLMSQDDGYNRNIDTWDPEGTAAGLADTAMRYGWDGMVNVGFEQCTTPVYWQWPGASEAHQRAYGDQLLALGGAKLAGVCDGSYT